MKKRKILKQFFIITIIISLLSILLFQTIITHIFIPHNNISLSVQKNIALAGKNYFQYEKEQETVFLDKLIKRGYIINQSYLIKNNCNPKLSTVTIKKINTNKYKYYVDLCCNNSYSRLTLSN